MKLAISNIAWDVAEDDAVAALLRAREVDAVDIAPSKYFPRPEAATLADIGQVKARWAGRGVAITGMQALLFGTAGLNVFGSRLIQESMLRHLEAVCRIGGGLGATRLVFGSPRNRDRTGLSDAATMAIAVAFFRRLGDIADAQGVVVCLEPNPPCYGGNFMTAGSETALVVEQVAHPAIRMQLDTGALAISGEDPVALLREHAGLIGHIHASEPNLVPLGDGATDHGKVSAALQAYLAGHIVSIEMLATQDEPHLTAIDRALGVAIRHYRGSDGGPAV